MSENNDDVMIFVDFIDDDDTETMQVSRRNPGERSKKSKEAIENALEGIAWVADGAKKVMKNVHNKPESMELEFGIKITTKAGILVAGTEGEFHIKAKLVWKKASEDE